MKNLVYRETVLPRVGEDMKHEYLVSNELTEWG